MCIVINVVIVYATGAYIHFLHPNHTEFLLRIYQHAIGFNGRW